MVTHSSLEGLATTCKRYGPGRLPKADRRAIGAGYAGASAAVAIALAFAVGMAVFHLLGSPAGVGHVFWAMSALVAVPIVVPAAFCASAAVWRWLPERVPYTGAVAGLLATVLTYLLSLAIVFAILLGFAIADGRTDLLVEAAGFTVIIGFFAAILTAWLTLPLGCVCGAVYERARQIPSGPAPTQSIYKNNK
ncbi:hypothetical protein D8Y22_16610 [Salinadaptatus halalkaliphilus]|uniref:Uncharacterized protein n=1 Tax=Salinadaptatus halalkaliphilus TaxID=2419781 RepID=A0A4S3TLG4_9EURY|nr:hypothetical protein [Salinadaptatus halalkaliphilus]THE63458.1 hypothetical protein D8Y22_16610 [Salinadaptatus halalkaliphilus]